MNITTIYNFILENNIILGLILTLITIITPILIYFLNKHDTNKNNDKKINLTKIELDENISYLEQLKKEISENYEIKYGYPIKLSNKHLNNNLQTYPEIFNKNKLKKLKIINDSLISLQDDKLWNINDGSLTSGFMEKETPFYREELEDIINNNKYIISIIDTIIKQYNTIKEL